MGWGRNPRPPGGTPLEFNRGRRLAQDGRSSGQRSRSSRVGAGLVARDRGACGRCGRCSAWLSRRRISRNRPSRLPCPAKVCEKSSGASVRHSKQCAEGRRSPRPRAIRPWRVRLHWGSEKVAPKNRGIPTNICREPERAAIVRVARCGRPDSAVAPFAEFMTCQSL